MYRIGANASLVLLLVLLSSGVALGAEQQIPSLRETYAPYFEIGAAVSPGVLYPYDELLQTHFSSLTLENAMKFVEVSRSPGSYRFH